MNLENFPKIGGGVYLSESFKVLHENIYMFRQLTTPGTPQNCCRATKVSQVIRYDTDKDGTKKSHL